MFYFVAPLMYVCILRDPLKVRMQLVRRTPPMLIILLCVHVFYFVAPLLFLFSCFRVLCCCALVPFFTLFDIFYLIFTL